MGYESRPATAGNNGPSTWHFKKPAEVVLTTADVTRATGIVVTPGMTVEHRYRGGVFEVRVFQRDEDLQLVEIADWTSVPAAEG